jgi:hypothetical protein
MAKKKPAPKPAGWEAAKNKPAALKPRVMRDPRRPF